MKIIKKLFDWWFGPPKWYLKQQQDERQNRPKNQELSLEEVGSVPYLLVTQDKDTAEAEKE